MNVAKQIEKIQLKIVKTKNDLLCEKHNTYYCYECIECKKEHDVIRDHENKVKKRIKEMSYANFTTSAFWIKITFPHFFLQ